ncbi:MAG TPA: glycosyltransferase family 39 protein [Rhizomicrobium sp.]|jgi:4-amino-4-deoxy-L-arabinose transferase-like glycosyltransferase
MERWHGVWQRSFPAIVLASITLLVHLIVNNRYGIFSDELYFIVCGQHPALGYVDQPPLVPFIAATSHALFGTALLPLRLVPALAMAATVALTAEFARALGGGRFAQWLAGLAVLFGGVFLVDGLLLLTDCLQPLTWLGCGWCILRLAQTKNERWWLAFGVIAGISLLSKYLILFFLVGLAVGLIVTPLRRSFRHPELYLGAAIALVLASPSLVWQAMHGWPFLELGQTAVNGKNLRLTPLAFFGQQVLFVGPAAVPIWLAGLWRFSIKPPLAELRIFPIAYGVMATLFLTLHGKAYYIAPIYPILLAGGAVAIETWLVWQPLRAGTVAIVTAFGILLAPLALPILPPERYASYAASLGIPSGAAATERGQQSPLPTHLAGMFGWSEMAAKVAAVYNALPANERANAVFYGRDYGEAAALDLLGPAMHGPPVIAGQNNYYLWGPRSYDGSVVIVLYGDVTPLMKNYRDIRVVGRIDSPFAASYEAHMPIYVLRHPRLSLKTLWPHLKHYE